MSPHNEPSNDVDNLSLQFAHPSVGLSQDEGINELRQFLKVVRPAWSHYNRQGDCNIDKVMAKLKSIGVTDYWDLMERVETNTLNEDLYAAGKVVFSEKTLDQIRHQRTFFCALENLKAPSFRQTGVFAPVPQMHARATLYNPTQTNALRIGAPSPKSASKSSSTGSLASAPSKRHSSTHSTTPKGRALGMTWPRPSTAENDQWRKPSWHQDSDTIDDGVGRRPASQPAGDLRSLSQPNVPFGFAAGDETRPISRGRSRPSLRYVRTGKEHLCWVAPAGKDGSEVSAEGANSSASQSLACSGSANRSRHSLELSASRRFSSNQAECAESEADSALLEEQAGKIKRAGSAMCAAPLLPRWANLTKDTLLIQGQAMLEEQREMDQLRLINAAISREGSESLTRKVIAKNIKQRLQDEAGREDKGVVDCHSHCSSIRKNLRAMANARQELGNVKLQAARSLGEEDKVDYIDKFGVLRLDLGV